MLELLKRRLASGLRMLQVREPAFSLGELQTFSAQVIGLAHRYGCKVMVKAPFAGADGIHFTAAELMRLERKPSAGLSAASCHTRAELERAMALELDFAVLGPVKASRGKDRPLGWPAFAALARGATIPVYAIGGLTPGDMHDAWAAGAHGVAMIRGSWS
jgi:8-oxo-dGTP diphosphatase